MRFIDEAEKHDFLDKEHLRRTIRDAVWIGLECAKSYGIWEAHTRIPKRESIEHHLIDLIKREIQNIKDGGESWEGLAIITKSMPEATPKDLSARYKEHGEKLKAWADRLEYELELILVPLSKIEVQEK